MYVYSEIDHFQMHIMSAFLKINSYLLCFCCLVFFSPNLIPLTWTIKNLLLIIFPVSSVTTYNLSHIQISE